MGYPSCLCSLKANVNESLQDISGKLKNDFKAVQSCVQNKTLTLNCSNCIPKEILCKCCVISCIKELRDKSKSQCSCLSNTSQSCQCKGTKEKCCKDFLSGLEACLSLLNLKGDMKDCKCDAVNCCKNGTCTNSKCNLCSPQNFPDNAMTGLGICPMNPRKLAERLENFFGDRSSKTCSCKCNGSKPSCCCLACESNKCSEACSCSPGSQCNHGSSQCPRQTFCSKINSIKVPSDSSEMTCCSKGQNCHCTLGSSNCSGQCCVVTVSGGSPAYYHSLKCLIRRLVKFFKDLSLDSSQSGCSKLCCELLCVLKTCEFLKTLFNASKSWAGKKSCGKCKGKGTGKCPQGTKQGSCCGGKPSACKSPDCCLGCQDCDAIKFRKALQTLRFAGPCGQELYRTLDDFLNFCCNVFWPYVDKKEVKEKINAAKEKCLSGCKSTGGKPCSCSDCLGCKALRGHNDIMAMLRHGYFSSYDSSNAKWESLCKSGSKCCCGQPSSSCSQCSPCCQSSRSCDPSKCCPDCPQRKAAKIFLGMVPCLYYGLKIIYDRCKYGSGFAGWHDISMNSDGNPSSDLAKFLSAWGYGLRPLISKKGSEFFSLLEKLFGSDSSGPLQKLSTLVTEKYFTSNLISPPKDPKTPSTVRSMLLWLYGLRFQKHFSELVENCKSLCLPFGNSFHPDAFCYYIYTSSFLAPVAIISLIEDSSSTATLLSSSSDWESFSYPEDLSSLFEKLCEYARKIFVALAFLYYQCERVPGQGGWRYCWYGKNCKVEPLDPPPSTSGSPSGCSSCPNSGSYLCTASKPSVHDHCRDGKSCLGFDPGSSVSCSNNSVHPQSNGQAVQCKNPCPHPLLNFLIDGSSESPSKDPQKFRTPFQPPEGFPRMGFSKENLPSPGRKGQDLYHDIYGFCKDGFYPLTRLVQFILCVSRHPPETLGELFGFFMKFAEALNSKSDLSSTFVDWINGEPGTFHGEYLRIAVQSLFNHRSHPSDLKSLYDCSSTKDFTCGKYLYPLTDNVAGVFTKELCSMYLSWICYRGPTFYSEFKDFHKEAEEKFKTCCKSCQKIVDCPCTLPFIYSQGFTFHSPSTLNCVDNEGNSKHNSGQGQPQHNEGDKNCTTKSCKNFIDQLKLVAEGQPFNDLLKEIESFLWSIRLPFFLFVLAFWAFVISYFLYVQLYKLDLLHLKSHAHFSRSFKILPSTLFSDASSRLKDLSYFTL
ncbi:variant erythrocyte surface antigen-1 family protein [Babesia divergens]|uniref:Variant erythrocyte surface antigen-1 family protein n=1 Tax=Babesia divergens TaxID=32595 RepID=A0AAD9GFX1_BABDI|nr:variant erythrocyte surface antigen-1 family protein [Babesia divergens]